MSKSLTYEDIILVNLDQGIVVLTNNVSVPIIHYLDCDGDDCEPEDCIVFVAGSEEYGWYTVSLQDFEAPPIH